MDHTDHSCFICGKPADVFYDFAVVENAHATQNTANYTQTQTIQKIAGIARIALCPDCLSERLDRYIKENTGSNGKPKFAKKKLVDECQLLRQKLDARDDTKTLELQILFFTTLSPFDEMVSLADQKPLWDCFYIPLGDFAVRRYAHLGDKFLAKAPDKVKARITSEVIDARYSLISMGKEPHGDGQPFTQAIEPAFPNSYYSLFFAECLDQLSNANHLPKALQSQAVDLKNYYMSRFV